VNQAGKADEAAGVRLGILGASDTKSGDRKSPKKESKVPGHRVTTVISVQGCQKPVYLTRVTVGVILAR